MPRLKVYRLRREHDEGAAELRRRVEDARKDWERALRGARGARGLEAGPVA